MTAARIAQMRKAMYDSERSAAFVRECLDEIERLQQDVQDANKAIKLAAKGRK